MVFITSWNVNGLRDIHKMKYVFSMCRDYNGLSFIQETFWDDKLVRQYSHLWNGQILYNNCPDIQRRGVAVLIPNTFQYKVDLIYCDTEGRIMKIKIHIEDRQLFIINVYAPNDNNNKVEFFNTLESIINIDDDNVILGDFNEILQRHMDRNDYIKTHNRKSSEMLRQMMTNRNLCDIWRYRNPDKREYTRQQKVENTLRQSRIDMCLISRSLISNAVNCFINSPVA